MQVKKFEARTMKEALQMVKQELGPEAIILSAKDNKKSYGLAGGGSIEITAAISEKSLSKKQYVERHLPEDAKEKFRSQSAKTQRAYIESTVDRVNLRAQQQAASATRRGQNLDPRLGLGAVSQRPVTTKRYIDIDDEDESRSGLNGRRVADVLADFMQKPALDMDIIEESAPRRRQSAPAPTQSQAQSTDEVISLRQEVDALRELLKSFQNNNVSQSGNVRTAPAQHVGAEHGLPIEFSAIYERLTKAGIEPRYALEILEKAQEELSGQEKKKASLVDAWVARYIMANTTVSGSWVKAPSAGQVHLFVGPGGHGKTTALVKIASQMVINERKKVAILSADTFKVGARDQLKIYAQILNVPFETVRHTIEFPQILKKYANYDMVLVDYPGVGLRDIREIDQIRSLMPERQIAKTVHLVLACGTKDVDAFEMCHRYQVTHFDDLIITKIDESYTHGFLYNIQRKTEKALYAFGVGQKIPEDIELATRERVLDLIYKITKK